MNYWKKIIKAVKESSVGKGASLNKITKMLKKAKYQPKQAYNQAKGKGFDISESAKSWGQRIKKEAQALSSKVSKAAKQVTDQKILPDKNQVLQAFDKATESIKKTLTPSQSTWNKLNNFNPKIYGSKAYQQMANQASSVKQSIEGSLEGLKNSAQANFNKASQSFKFGSKVLSRTVLKYIAIAIFIYGVAVTIPKQVLKYYIRKQQLDFERQKFNRQQTYGKLDEGDGKKIRSTQQFDYPSKQQALRKEDIKSNKQVFDYNQIRGRQIEKSKSYDY